LAAACGAGAAGVAAWARAGNIDPLSASEANNFFMDLKPPKRLSW
jgi:hypothetical protein